MAAASQAPKMGRLSVERESLLGATDSPLDRVPVGNSVTVTATISGARSFPGRVGLVLEDEQGDSAVVIVDSGKAVRAFQAAGVAPGPGVRVQLHGVVTAPIGDMPKGIQAHAIRVVA